MKLFLDTNVVLDFVLNRTPFSEDASLIIEISSIRKFEIYISSTSITDIYYILSKKYTKKIALEFIMDLAKNFNLTNVNHSTILEAIKSNFNDFEDAVQYQSALDYKVNFIITRNAKDFTKSKIKVLSPNDFIKKYA